MAVPLTSEEYERLGKEVYDKVKSIDRDGQQLSSQLRAEIAANASLRQQLKRKDGTIRQLNREKKAMSNRVSSMEKAIESLETQVEKLNQIVSQMQELTLPTLSEGQLKSELINRLPVDASSVPPINQGRPTTRSTSRDSRIMSRTNSGDSTL